MKNNCINCGADKGRRSKYCSRECGNQYYQKGYQKVYRKKMKMKEGKKRTFSGIVPEGTKIAYDYWCC